LLFQRNRARVILKSDGEPLPYWQPAMAEPLDATGERRFILMCRPMQPSSCIQFDTQDAIEFIYEQLYQDAYGGTGEVELPGFKEYIRSVRHRVEKDAEGSYLGKYNLPKGLFMGLMKIVHKEGIRVRLAL